MNLFPAKVTFGFEQTTSRPVRVILIDGTLFVYDLIDKQPAVIAEMHGAVLERAGRLTRAAGEVHGAPASWTIERAAGCGCGNPLRHFKPPGARRTGT